ncbi:MAG: DegQ family serine endoprotease [Mariprofundaceae bacterium]
MVNRCFAVLLLFVLVLPGVATSMPADFSEIAAQSKPSVVNISATQIARHAQHRGMPPGLPPGSPFEDFFGEFFRNMPVPPRERHSLGSGFLISEEGYVVTNNHVVENADEIIVTASDGNEYEAELVGTDAKLDLALLKIDSNGIKPVKLGDSDALRVGEWVVAIGNPFGLEQTVTAGIVSAKGRVIGAGPYDDFIQTDASINPGNSGGPLFNSKGEVIGINTAIISRSGGNVGIGFAIPIKLAKPVLDELRATGRVSRARLGVYIEDVSKDVMKAMDLPDTNGALVRRVESGSAAAKAGIEAGDVIIAIDGETIKRVHDLPIRVASHKPGDKVKIKLIRDGKRKTLIVTVEAMPEDEVVARAGDKSRAKLGLALSDLTEELAEELGSKRKKGVVVRRVMAGSPADRAGIEQGDIIFRVNRQSVSNTKDFKKHTKSLGENDVLQVMIEREGDQVFVVMRAPAGDK